MAVRAEWQRILRPGGLALIYWNSRLLDASPFLIGYEQLLLDYGTDYTAVAERYQDDATMQAWFGPGLRGMVELPACNIWISTPCAAPAVLLLRTPSRSSAPCADDRRPAGPVRRPRGRRPGCF